MVRPHNFRGARGIRPPRGSRIRKSPEEPTETKKPRNENTMISNEVTIREQNKGPSLLDLSNELIAMIFKCLGKPPTDAIYKVTTIEDLHPCYAICGTSKFMRAWYLATMGQPSTRIEVTILPHDYISIGADAGEALKARLAAFGPLGIDRIYSCRLEGPALDRDTGVRVVDDWLGPRSKVKRLEPEHKALVKRYVEQNIRDKTNDMRLVLQCIGKVLNNVKEVKIFPGELPSLAWSPVIKDFVINHQDTLRYLHFVSSNTFEARFPFVKQLTSNTYFPERAEQPENYPVSFVANRDLFIQLEYSIRNFLLAKRALLDVEKHVA